MMSITRFLTLCSVTALLAMANPVLAQDKAGDAPTTGKDHTLTKEELAKYAVMANKQLVTLTEAAIDRVKSGLEDSGLVTPIGMMIMNDGTLKPVDLDDKAKEAPLGIKIVMYRAALKSMARHDKITGATIVYGVDSKDGGGKSALVVEYEHRLGVSGMKLIPYSQDSGKVTYGKVLSKSKPFQMFYDPRPDQQAKASKGS